MESGRIWIFSFRVLKSGRVSGIVLIHRLLWNRRLNALSSVHRYYLLSRLIPIDKPAYALQRLCACVVQLYHSYSVVSLADGWTDRLEIRPGHIHCAFACSRWA